MTRISCIVEGHGEVIAVPVLLRRIGEWRSPQEYVDVPPPIRVHRDRFLNRDDEFSRHLKLASSKCGDDGWVLILLDADDDCPATMGQQILDRARHVVPHKAVSVVLAKREYEAWMIGAADSLNGCRGLNISPADLQIDAEAPRDAKGWLRERKSDRTYGETTDQAAFSAIMDLAQAHARCRSFRKLCSEWDHQLARRPAGN
ncbi:DUF4276 family protein [Pandoraea pulmonicola]|uniref:DUF4276 family protein n=1 Tax=Pandoraea pulmonicola TaxID=93221 RepID=UPI000934A69A|nr:DUF4276 family protein [Pandoraea pulmonicola]